MKENNLQGELFNATDSYLGYLYQGLYALLVLLDADDDSVVSVETEDDIHLVGNNRMLFQIKHSRSRKGSISENTDSFWKTMRIWCSKPRNGNYCYVLTTCCPVKPRSTLDLMCKSSISKQIATQRLTEIAEKILNKRRVAMGRKGGKLPFEKRYKGAEAFLDLDELNRQQIVDQIHIRPESFDISGLPDEVESRLKNTLRAEKRDFIVDRLIEWWHQRVVTSLLNRNHREIRKLEVQDKIAQLITDTADDMLPDLFSMKKPDDITEHIGITMEAQIQLVNGGDERIKRAALARYRAINQRRAWLEYDISLATSLTEYDERLIEAWRDYHGPLRHDLAASSEVTKKEKGRKLLDWSHQNAFSVIVPPRRGWAQSFYTSGIYQQLADELKVGWHPDYEKLLAKKKDGEDEDVS